MTTAALRKEIHGYIDSLPENKLAALKTLLVDTSSGGDEIPIIEPAGFWERMKAKRLMRHPENFVPFTPSPETVEYMRNAEKQKSRRTKP